MDSLNAFNSHQTHCVYVKKVMGAGAWYESYDEFKIAEENAVQSMLE
jgi:hypothetical protein